MFLIMGLLLIVLNILSLSVNLHSYIFENCREKYGWVSLAIIFINVVVILFIIAKVLLS